MSEPHFQIDHMIDFHNAGEVTLPQVTRDYLLRMQPKAHAIPPTLTMSEAVIIEILWRTYIKGAGR